MPMSPRLLRPLARFQAPPAIHPEALDWSGRVAANGGSVSPETLSAVSQFCDSIDAAGLRSAMLRCNLFCGNDLEACLVPLYRGASVSSALGAATDINANFVASDYDESAGLTGDSATKYLDTGFTSSLFPSLASIHLSASGVDVPAGGDYFFLGAHDGTEPGLITLDSYAFYVTGRAFRAGAASPGEFPVFAPVGDEEPHMVGVLETNSYAALYRSGVIADSNTHDGAYPSSFLYPFYVFALNISGSAVAISGGTIRMYSIGSGLTASQVSAFSAAVVAFNTALGRA